MAFIDEAQVSFLEDMMSERGFLDTRQMACAFQLLRSYDLVWPAMVQTYLRGERRPVVGLMAWNADATRVRFRMHSQHLRHLFLGNDLAEGRYEAGGRAISLRDIRIPAFAVSTIADQAAPWRSVYKIQTLTDTDVTFVLSRGGHNAGIVSPLGLPNRHHQIATHKEHDKSIDPHAWQQTVVRDEGSRWRCWQDWLAQHSTEQVPPPPMGVPRKGYAPLVDAPATYVLEP